MADFTALKTAIQTYIKQNGNEEITGEKLQDILLSMVTTLGDSAINDLVTALNDEVAARQNADGTLQQNITNEATARGNADTALGGRIDDEATARANGDTALSTRLGSTITAENTAADQIGAEAEARAAADTALQGLIDGITDNIKNGYVYAGIATPSSTPATGKVFYLALTAGTYTNFGSTVVSQGINILKYNGSAWLLDVFIGIDDTPTPNSPKLVKSGGVAEELALGAVYDVSAKNPTAGPNNDGKWESLSALLSDANLNTLIPTAVRKGGMSIKFVCTNDNKYAQYRYTEAAVTGTSNLFINPNNWQKISNEYPSYRFVQPNTNNADINNFIVELYLPNITLSNVARITCGIAEPVQVSGTTKYRNLIVVRSSQSDVLVTFAESKYDTAEAAYDALPTVLENDGNYMALNKTKATIGSIVNCYCSVADICHNLDLCTIIKNYIQSSQIVDLQTLVTNPTFIYENYGQPFLGNIIKELFLPDVDVSQIARISYFIARLRGTQYQNYLGIRDASGNELAILLEEKYNTEQDAYDAYPAIVGKYGRFAVVDKTQMTLGTVVNCYCSATPACNNIKNSPTIYNYLFKRLYITKENEFVASLVQSEEDGVINTELWTLNQNCDFDDYGNCVLSYAYKYGSATEGGGQPSESGVKIIEFNVATKEKTLIQKVVNVGGQDIMPYYHDGQIRIVCVDKTDDSFVVRDKNWNVVYDWKWADSDTKITASSYNTILEEYFGIEVSETNCFEITNHFCLQTRPLKDGTTYWMLLNGNRTSGHRDYKVPMLIKSSDGINWEPVLLVKNTDGDYLKCKGESSLASNGITLYAALRGGGSDYEETEVDTIIGTTVVGYNIDGINKDSVSIMSKVLPQVRAQKTVDETKPLIGFCNGRLIALYNAADKAFDDYRRNVLTVYDVLEDVVIRKIAKESGMFYAAGRPLANSFHITFVEDIRGFYSTLDAGGKYSDIAYARISVKD